MDDISIFNGNGLKNIKNRVYSFKGEIDIHSEINSGTKFEIVFPILD